MTCRDNFALSVPGTVHTVSTLLNAHTIQNLWLDRVTPLSHQAEFTALVQTVPNDRSVFKGCYVFGLNRGQNNRLSSFRKERDPDPWPGHEGLDLNDLTGDLAV